MGGTSWAGGGLREKGRTSGEVAAEVAGRAPVGGRPQATAPLMKGHKANGVQYSSKTNKST